MLQNVKRTITSLMLIVSATGFASARNHSTGIQLPDRKIALHSTRNTRELGGISVRGGIFRKNMVYRSGALCAVNLADVERLKRLNLHTLMDLRTRRDIHREGQDRSALLSSIPNFMPLPMDNSRGLCQEAYYYYIRENACVFATAFKTFATAEDYPVLYHCSAGKDRTGIITALLLELLGAKRDVIMADYLQSKHNSGSLKVEREWLEEVFTYVDRFGGVENFLHEQGVPREDFAKIRALLIEPGSPAQTDGLAHS